MAAERRAEVNWQGSLMEGSGSIRLLSSEAAGELPVTWASRTETPGGKTSPEELIAAAHASCFAMQLSSNLAKAGTPPERLEVSAQVTFDKPDGGWTVVSSALTVRGKVPGADEANFRQAAEAAKDGCPISRALSGNVEMTVDARLQS